MKDVYVNFNIYRSAFLKPQAFHIWNVTLSKYLLQNLFKYTLLYKLIVPKSYYFHMDFYEETFKKIFLLWYLHKNHGIVPLLKHGKHLISRLKWDNAMIFMKNTFCLRIETRVHTFWTSIIVDNGRAYVLYKHI